MCCCHLSLVLSTVSQSSKNPLVLLSLHLTSSSSSLLPLFSKLCFTLFLTSLYLFQSPGLPDFCAFRSCLYFLFMIFRIPAFIHGRDSALKLYGGQFTLSTQLIIINYPVILFHRRSTTVSLETYPLYAYVNLVICLRKVLIARKIRKTCSRRSQKELQLLECFKNFLGVSYLDKCSADV